MLAPHADGVAIFVLAVGLNAGVPVVVDGLRIDAVVVRRRSVSAGPGVPLFDVVPQHHLGMRRSHHDAVRLGVGGVLRVLVEFVGHRVHRRPEKIRLQAQEQLEDLLVGLRARFLPGVQLGSRPGGEVFFVVDEDAAVLDRRLALLEHAAVDGDGRRRCGRDVSPPVPGRDADSLRQLVDAVDGPPSIAAGDDESSGHAGHRIRHRLDDGRFPFSGDTHGVQLPGRGQRVDGGALAQRSHHDRRSTRVPSSSS